MVLLPEPSEPDKAGSRVTAGGDDRAVGIQIDAVSYAGGFGHEALRAIGDLPWLFLPLDEGDANIATRILRALPRGRALAPSSVAALEPKMAGLRLLIASSGELGERAGAAGVPFVSTALPSRVVVARARAALGLDGGDAGDGSALRRIAANLHPIVARLARDLEALHAEVAAQHRRIGELAAEVDRQGEEIARRERLLAEIVESRAWRWVTAIREALARLRPGVSR